MALSQTELQTRITALRKARDSGVLMVRHGDEITTFRNLKELNEILADLESELSGANGDTPTKKVKYISQESKGF